MRVNRIRLQDITALVHDQLEHVSDVFVRTNHERLHVRLLDVIHFDANGKFKEKYPRIPEWEWLNRNFRLKLEEESHVLEQVRSSVSEKLDVLARNTIEPIIAGGESYCCYFERKMLSEAQKDELWDIYRRLQALRTERDPDAVDQALGSLRRACEFLAQVTAPDLRIRIGIVEQAPPDSETVLVLLPIPPLSASH
jgi:hypothetical protein